MTLSSISGSIPQATLGIGRAVTAGENLALVGRYLGYLELRSTAGYAHFAGPQLFQSAEKVGSIISEATEFEVRLL